MGQLADIAAFSSFHFHRIFKALVGESLYEYIHRLRLEKAMYLLRYHRDDSITQIAIECGFSSAAHFSRMFRKKYGFSASEFRRESKNSKKCKASPLVTQYIVVKPLEKQSEDFDIRIVTFPATHIAYISVTDSYAPGKIEGAFDELVRWDTG